MGRYTGFRMPNNPRPIFGKWFYICVFILCTPTVAALAWLALAIVIGTIRGY